MPYHRGSSLGPIAKKSRTPKLSYCPECGTALFHGLQSGTMCEVCLSEWSGLRLTLSTGDSPVRTEVLQGLAKAWQESNPRFFTKLHDSQKRSNRHSFSSKTLGARAEMSKRCDPPFVRLSTTQERALWRRRKLEQITGETGFGFWPTPTASNYGSNQGGGAGRVGKIRKSISGLIGGPPSPEFLEWLMGYPSGWTAIEPWATQWCRSKRAKRS